MWFVRRLAVRTPFFAVVLLVAACGGESELIRANLGDQPAPATSSVGDVIDDVGEQDSSPSSARSSGPTSTSTGTELEATLPDALTELGIDVDVDLVYAGFCLAWRFDIVRDDGSINDAVSDLFRDQADGGSLFTPEQLNDAVRAGCAENSAIEGAATALETLSLTSADIEQLIDAACVRYAQAPSVRGVPGAQEFDFYVSALLGMDHDELTALVLGVCGTEPFESYQEPPSVLPERDLTHGEVDIDFDVAAACLEPPDQLLIPADMAEAVLDTYKVNASDFDVQRLVPFALGGATTPANLFPIPIDAHPGASDKSDVDTLVIGLVCDGSVSIDAARMAIIDDWPSAYARLNN